MVVFSADITAPMGIGEVTDKIFDSFFLDDGTPRLISPEWEDPDQLFFDGIRHTVYMPFESSRGIKVWREGDSFKVRILPFSTNAEFDMALRFLELCTEYGAKLIETNIDNVAFPISELRSRFSLEFNEAFNRSALRSLLLPFERGEISNTILPGPIMKFVFGPVVARVLLRQPDERIRVQALLDMMKRLQFALMTRKYSNCNAPAIKRFLSKKIAVVKPDVQYVVSEVDTLRFEHQSNAVEISWTDFLLNNINRFTEDKLQLFDEFSVALKLNVNDIGNLLKTPAFANRPFVPAPSTTPFAP